MRSIAWAVVAAAALALGMGAWTTARVAGPSDAAQQIEAGRKALEAHACGVCHHIPGVRGPQAAVGPPLTAYARRIYIAGRLPNTEEQLARWIIEPGAFIPDTAMPAVGVSEDEARAMAAFLHSLR